MGHCNCAGACRTTDNPNYTSAPPLTIQDVRRVIREELQDYEARRLRKMAKAPQVLCGVKEIDVDG